MPVDVSSLRHPVSLYFLGVWHLIAYNGSDQVLQRFRPGYSEPIPFSDGETAKVVAEDTADERVGFEMDRSSGALLVVYRKASRLYDTRAAYPGETWLEGIAIPTDVS